MSSVSRASLESVIEQSSGAPFTTVDGASILAAGRAIESTPQLQAALTDSVVDADGRAGLAERAFASLAAAPRAVVANAARARWSDSADLLDALEVVGIQLAAQASGTDSIGDELRQFTDVVAENPELELTLNDRLAPAEGKAGIVRNLLSSKVSEATQVIVDHLVRSPRGRRVRALLTGAQVAVSNASGEALATITTARKLPDEQLARLASGLEKRYERKLRVTQVVDPTIIGGLRITVGDDVIDGTLRTKYNDLRLQLG